eukprot:4194822-Alexandrium_andersonii.AAC.1
MSSRRVLRNTLNATCRPPAATVACDAPRHCTRARPCPQPPAIPTRRKNNIVKTRRARALLVVQ